MTISLEFLRNKPLWRKINLLLTYAVVFTFPFPLYISLKVLGLWILSSLVIFDWGAVRRSVHKVYFLFVVLYYVAYLIGCLYSQDISGAWHQLAMKIYLLLFPFMFASLDVMYKRYFDRILSWYVLGQVAAFVILLVIAFASSWHNIDGQLVFDPRVDRNYDFWHSFYGGGNYFFYTVFSRFMHPSYAGLEASFAIAVLVFLRRNPYGLTYGKLTHFLTQRFICLALMGILTLAVLMYGSRANLIGISALYFFVVLTAQIRPMALKIFVSLVVLALGVLVIIYNPRVESLTQKVENYDQLTWIEKIRYFNRVFFWYSAYEIGSSHPLFGVGTGDLQWHLYRKYAQLDMVRYMDPSYNSHNEFLENFGRLGLMGLLPLLGMFLYAFAIGVYDRRRLLLMFLVLVFVNFMFEVFLNRAAGTSFIAFFLNFLLLLDFRDLNLPKISFLNG